MGSCFLHKRFICGLIQDKAGRRAFSTVSNKDRFLDLMIINCENAASHKYVVQKGKSL